MKTAHAVLLLIPFVLPLPASAAVGEWGQGAQAEARLVASGVGPDGKLAAAIEIALPKGSKTYWRSPGDAGVPPVADFSASTNVGPVAVAFPVPARDDDGFAVTNVYHDGVVLPLTAAIADPAKPVNLSVDLKLGVCDQVCVPDEIKASLTVAPGDHDAAAASALVAAEALVPGAPEPGVFALDTVTRTGGTDGRPVFRFTGTVPDAAHADVFVEGPADWAPYKPELQASADGKAVWDIQFSRLGSTVPIPGANFRVTIRSGTRAIDQTLALQ